MNINIYSKYKVKYNCYGGEIDEENSTPNDIVFKTFNYENSIIENGGILAERIARYMEQTDFQEITINDNLMTIEFFNPNNGEASTINMIIEKENDDKMKSAGELFEDLGYKKHSANEWDIIYMKSIPENSIWDDYFMIDFLISKQFAKCEVEKRDRSGHSIPITFNELQAIYKQLEELGCK